MAKLRMLRPKVSAIDTRTARPPMQTPERQAKLRAKIKDPIYDTPQFRAWRTAVVQRAGGRCEAVDYGERCTRTQPHHRLYADHIVELRDGGAPFDPGNGQCLCRSHHELKTVALRRLRSKAGG